MANAGITPSLAVAAKELLEACVGSLRPDGNLPRAEVSGAMTFLRAIDNLHGLGDSDQATLETLQSIQSVLAAENRPYKGDWCGAAEVLRIEHIMTSAIRKVTAQDYAERAQVVESGSLRRRARATL